MKFHEMKIRNFMCFTDVEYDFSNKGLTLITGSNHDNIDRSNGSGKSTLIEAMMWCLFGETTKRLKSNEVLNRDNDFNCCVELNIEDNEFQYKIIRYRKDLENGNDVLFYVNNELTVGKNNNETQDIINNQLNINFKLLCNSVIFPQETKFKFITATDNEKKAILTDLLDLNYIDKAQEEINSKIKGVESDIAEEDMQLKSTQDMINSYQEEEKELSSKYTQWCAHQKSKIVEKELEINDLYAKVANCKANTFNEEMLSEINDKLAALSDKKTKIESYEGKKETLKDKFYEIKERAAHYQTIIDPLEKDIKKIETMGTGECSKCFQDVQESHIADLLEAKKNKLNEVLPKLESVREKLSGCKSKINKVSEIITKKPIITTKIEKYKEQLSLNDKISNQINGLNREIEIEKKALSKLQEETNPYVGMSDGLCDKINKLQDNCDKIVKKLNENKELLQYYKFWKEGFSNKGIKSFIFDGIVSDLNDKIEYYLNEMFDGRLHVELDMESTTAKGELRQKLNTNIMYDGDVVSYESLSGGEKRSISLAVDLALSNIVSQYNQKNFDILVFDECVDHLDLIGKERFLDLLNLMNKDSIFVISHDLSFQQKFNNMIEITKENGESRIL